MRNNTFLKIKKKKFTHLLCLLFPLTTLCGCNMMEGVGTDIKEGGKALERAAEDKKERSRPCLPDPCPCCGRRY